MFNGILHFMQWLWHAIVYPYVINALLSLGSDGLEAFAHIGETLYVLFFFFAGRSHRDYPPSHKVLAARKEEAMKYMRERSKTAAAPLTISQEETPQDGSTGSEDTTDDEKQQRRTVSDAAEGLTARSVDPSVLIQRRLLLGKRGELEQWLPEIAGRTLIPMRFPLRFSHSLHTLVGNVIGAIQQPTVSTLPSRHPAPQWPPHFARPRASRAFGEHNATTDEYSSSATSTAHTVGRRVAQPASSVVYRRVNTRQLDLARSSRPAQLIAPITSHHVLSYQATRQKVLVMDLDETLCHVSTSTAFMQGPPTFSEVIPTAAGSELFHVWVRPYARLFLTTVAKLYNMVLFTSASKPYADTILRRIDPDNTLQERYYRQDCRVVSRGALLRTLRSEKGRVGGGPRSGGEHSAGAISTNPSDSGTGTGGGKWGSPLSVSNEQGDTDTGIYSDGSKADRHAFMSCERSNKPNFNENSKVLIKDLRALHVPPELLVMIDNSEECTLLNRESALIIPPYIPSAEKLHKENAEGTESLHKTDEDEVLLALISFLECLLVVPDVRSVLWNGHVF